MKRRRYKNLKTSYTEPWFRKSVLLIPRNLRPIPSGPVDTREMATLNFTYFFNDGNNALLKNNRGA